MNVLTGFRNRRSGMSVQISVIAGLVLLLSVTPLFAQQEVEKLKPNYELANKFTSQNLRQYTYDSSVRPNWIEDSDMFWYTYRNSTGRNYYLVDPVDITKKPVFDNAEFAAALSARFHKPYDPTQLPSLTIKFVKDMQAIEFAIDTVRYEYDLTTGELDSVGIVERRGRAAATTQRGRGGTVSRGAGSREWRNFSPDSTIFAYAKNYNLYVMGADSIEHQLTFDGEDNYSFGGDTSKTRRVSARVTWSEDSKRFYTQRSDSRKVEMLYLVNEVAPAPEGSDLTYARPQLREYQYAMPGDEFVNQYELFVYDAPSRNFMPVPIEKWKDQRLSSTRWGKNSNELYFQRKDRTQDRHDVCLYKVDTGEAKVLISEYIQDSYVETQGIRYLNDYSELIWWSERDGWGHYYLFDGDGNLKNQITSGAFRAGSITRIDTTGRVLYFNANGREPGENPYYNHFYRVNFDGTGLKLLNPGNASHSVSMSPSDSDEYFIDNYSRIDMAPRSDLLDNMGNLIMPLEETDVSRLKEIGWDFPEAFKVKSADGVWDVYGVMFKPFDFDPNKKYPIIAHVYPGPQTESITFTFSPTNRDMTLAQLGFIVIHIGNRGGSPQRSKAYHNYGFGNLRDYGLADKKAGIEQLSARYTFIDIERVGIYGHSGGGFMSTAAMVVPPYNDFFKVAVSSSGNHDNNMYNANWSEKHHGIKEVEETETERGGQRTERTRGDSAQEEEEDKITFEITVPANHEMAENLKGRLLLVHGTMDNNVHPGNTIRMADALIKANKRFDLMMLPGQAHGFGSMNDYFIKLLWDYFAEHLIGNADNNVDLFEKK